MILLAGAVILNKNKVLLIQSNKDQKGSWGPPAGHQENNETAKETVIRETKEETNLDIIPKGIIQIGYFYYKQKDYLFVTYLAKAKNIKKIKLQDVEVSNYTWANLNDLKRNKYPLRKKFLLEPLLLAFKQRPSKINLLKHYKIEV